MGGKGRLNRGGGEREEKICHKNLRICEPAGVGLGAADSIARTIPDGRQRENNTSLAGTRAYNRVADLNQLISPSVAPSLFSFSHPRLGANPCGVIPCQSLNGFFFLEKLINKSNHSCLDRV